MVSLNIISLGLGVQSTALYYMSSLGELPHCDYAIFADPGREKTATTEYLFYLQNWQKVNNGIPIIITNKKNLYEDLLNKTNSSKNRFASIPAFTGNSGMLRRQCTSEYKIAPINKEIRKLYDIGNKRLPLTYVWIGITLDESSRMSIPQGAWRVNVYPFCGYQISKKSSDKFYSQTMHRSGLMKWYEDHNLPIPVKSSCVFCPFQSDASWLRQKTDSPHDFADAIKIDNAIRNSTERGIKEPIFLHRNCKPLSEVKFDDTQTNWLGDCTDGCHI